MDISELKKTDFTYYQRHPWEVARAKIILHLIKKNEKKFHHLLDVGSGDAYVLNELCRHNIAENYTATDIAYEPAIVEQIIANSACHINFIQEFPVQMQPSADLILLLDVIEHCKNDATILQDIKNVSSDNFKLLITVPAFQSLFSKHDELLLHYRRYTVQQLTDLCKTQGLKIEEAGYFFFTLSLIRWVQLFLEKIGLRKPDKTITNWKAKKWITSIFTSLLWTDYKIGNFFLALGFRLPGLSAYCICRPLPL
jgi:hypothetical protein